MPSTAPAAPPKAAFVSQLANPPAGKASTGNLVPTGPAPSKVGSQIPIFLTIVAASAIPHCFSLIFVVHRQGA